ncbi:Sirohydrochlorin ferrochelatase [Brevibacterium siliguriense]|uniref:Sirohydrochlorin ferrochelatase n=1 Tax=Brevibacterium siliguriense TaxID=1136497 RepID=A0A1H1LBR9_9MICO|nr:CbiX/SirB N-terminal domain-containing protein [Brevibacterium siliguriense]SDR72004.1 Sirohydrochlorin ferrochelatase [Brevibacterium siliguriense]
MLFGFLGGSATRGEPDAGGRAHGAENRGGACTVTALPSVGLISHGTSSPTGQVLIEVLAAEVATDLRIRGIADEVMLGHVDVQKPDVDEVIARLPADRPVILVPLLLSPGYHVHVDLAEAADRAERMPPNGDGEPGFGPRRVRRAPTLGPDPRLAEILADRLPALSDNDGVILAAAGSSDERANEACCEMGRLLAAKLERPVEVGFLAGAGVPLRDRVEEARSRGARPVLANYLLAPGFFDDLARKLVDGGTASIGSVSGGSASIGNAKSGDAGGGPAGVLAPPLLTGGGSASAVPPQLVDIVRDRVREGIRAHGHAHARTHQVAPEMLSA